VLFLAAFNHLVHLPAALFQGFVVLFPDFFVRALRMLSMISKAISHLPLRHMVS
jgi:hypothetical protein